MSRFEFVSDFNKLDNRSISINETLKKIYENNGGDLNASIVEASSYLKTVDETIRNVYEVVESEIPLYAYHNLMTLGADNYGFTDAEHETALSNTITACRDYYGDPIPNEYILCAAINYRGIIVSGKRHGDCYDTLYGILGSRDIKDNPCREQQGFLTSYNRYVDRKEGWVIAKKNNQIKYGLEASENGPESTLISENLY